MTAIGDKANVFNMPLINVLTSTYGTNPVVLKLFYCYRHLAGGGKRDAEYIAKIFLPEMERLDPEKNRFYLFIVDRASNIQGTGEFVEAVFPWVHTIHGVEHVLEIFFKDISEITEIKVNDLCDISSIFFYH